MLHTTAAAGHAAISFTVLPDVHATGGLTRGSAPWADLCTWLLDAAHTYPAKDRCPLIKLATFGDVASPVRVDPATGARRGGSLRHDGNVTAIYGIEGDYDAEQLPMPVAAQLLQSFGVEALLYTSPSHTPGRPRWRVLAPLANVYAPEHRAHFVGLLNLALGGVLATESFTCSQSYYFGRVAGAPFESLRTQGQPIDVAMQGQTPLMPVSRVATVVADDWTDAPVPEWSGPTDDDELVQRLLRTPQTAANAFAGRASFRDLWEANTEALARTWPSPKGDAFNRSEADAALASHLAWGTGKHHERMRLLMERSALKRDKWERDGYLADTVRRMAARTTRVMQDRAAAVAVAGAAPAVGGSFVAASAGAIPATLVNVQAALRAAESGVRLAYDAFKDAIVLAQGEQWRTFTDVDYVTLRTAFEERGFKPVSGDLMRDAVLAVSMGNTVDTAVMWASSLQWDGVSRVDGAMARYFGTASTPYSRAVGRYLFTALAGRVLDPGCQADMALILVGPQGVRKTSTVRNLAPTLDSFVEINLEKLDDNTARSLRGKIVGELAELRGLKGRDAESIRAWITRRHEAWVPKYKEFETHFPRRCVFVGTANGREVLFDPFGHRRWLPIDSGDLDPEALAADRAQLWAEGVALWRAHGVLWQDAQQLAKAEHSAFEEVDEWAEVMATTLAKPRPAGPGEVPNPTPFGAVPFSILELARVALGLDPSKVGGREKHRIGDILRRFKYEKRQTWINGRNCMRWHAPSPTEGLGTH